MAERRDFPALRILLLALLSSAPLLAQARRPASAEPPHDESSEKPRAGDEKDKDKDKSGSTTVDVTSTLSEPLRDAGQRIAIEKPHLWTWQPRGDVYLPHASGIVFAAAHADGRALIVVEQLP